MNHADLLTIVEKGLLAPSADNLQPWKFKVTSGSVELFLDRSRIKNFCDEGYFVPYLSAGAVIENMRIAGRRLGYQFSTFHLPQANEPLHIATLRFDKTKKEPHPHFDALNMRTTNRKFYNRSQIIDETIYLKLSNLVEAEHETKLLWIKKNELPYQALSRLLGSADQLRFEQKRLHREFNETLRINPKEAEKTKDGLDLRTLEAGFFGNLLFKTTRSWKWMNCFNMLGASTAINFYTQMQLNSSQAVGLIVSKSNRPIDYLHGGEIMERTWHEITMQKLAIQPLEALPIFIINFNLTGGRDFSAAQREKLKRMKQEFLSLFQINDQMGLIFLFRIGYASPPRIHSFRRPLEEFLIES